MLIHIAIVSDQILANLIPALMERPDKVYLVTSAAMSAKGMDNRLKKQLARQGIATEIRQHAPDTGLEAIREYAFGLHDDILCAHPEATLVLNATGGTKLMALGFVEMLRKDAARVIYTDTAHQRIEVLYDRNQDNPSPIPMQDVLDVRAYLSAQGFVHQGDQTLDKGRMERMTARKPVCKYLARHAAGLGDFIGAINALAGKALDERGEQIVWPPQSFREKPKGRWAEALREITRAGLLEWDEGVEIDFRDAESTRFLQGGWLEEYAWHVVRDERVHDTRLNVRGTWEGAQQAKNEFDVLACHRNQLLFIECKTLKFDAGQNDNDLSYKVESLGKDTRGLYGETWLLSARDPSDVLRDRSRQAGFKLIGPAELPHLREWVQAWMQKSLLPPTPKDSPTKS